MAEGALMSAYIEINLSRPFSGAGPTVLRAMVVSTTQLGTYDQVT